MIGSPQPLPAASPLGPGQPAPYHYDSPHMPGYAWPSYAAYPNYASVTYPSDGWDTTGNTGPGGTPNDHLENTIRFVKKTTLTWDPVNFRYNIAAWNTTGALPPPYMGAAPNGEGDYVTALIVDPNDAAGNTVYVVCAN